MNNVSTFMSRQESSTAVDQNGLSLKNHTDVLLRIAEEDNSRELSPNDYSPVISPLLRPDNHSPTCNPSAIVGS